MDYYCTWRTQRMRLDSKLVPPGAAQGQLRIPMRDNLHEGVLFGSEGWVETLYPDVRDRLFFVLDDGWDVPPGTDSAKDRARFGSLIPDAARFPSLEGSPAAKLGRLSERIMAAGWAGLGLWVSPQQQGEDQQICLGDADAAETYWRERARWSGEAGIRYWKVDWGRHDHDLDYRRMITRVAAEEAPHLLVEHEFSGGMFNDLVENDAGGVADSGRFRDLKNGVTLAGSLEAMSFSAVFRTYDVTAMLSAATTLDRAYEMLARAPAGCSCVLNVEDEHYIAAVTHCAAGVMRSPLPAGRSPLPYVNAFDVYHRDTETLRAVNWRRLAPVLPAGTLPVLSEGVLTDAWQYEERPDRFSGLLLKQGAPTRIALGMELPEVVPLNTDAPRVICSRHPNGAVAIATLSVTTPSEGIHTPPATVRIDIPAGTETIGVFGQFHALELRGVQAAGWTFRDLAGGKSVAPETQTYPIPGGFGIPGAVLDKIGMAMNPPGDVSYPGVLMRKTQPS